MSRKRIALAILLVLVAALVAATARWIVWPHTDPAPRHADAVVVLGGGGGERLAEGLRLVKARVARVLVISEGERPGWTEANRLCKGGALFEVVCFDPEPGRTQGEARAMARLAEERGWKDVVVVTSDYHAIRAGRLFARCFGHDVPVVAAGPDGLPGVGQILHEWLAYAHASLIERDC
jgi:uncharacterized SAM-binding protein YcdF (DUF218 family)